MKKIIFLSMLMMLLVSAFGYAVSFENGVIHSLKQTGNGISIPSNSGEILTSIAIDNLNNITYIAGDNFMFYAYNQSSNTTKNLSQDVGSTQRFSEIGYDSVNNYVYMGDSDGEFFWYDVETATFNDMNSIGSEVKSIRYVSSQNSAYVMGASSLYVYRVSSNTIEDISGLMNSLSNLKGMDYNSDDNILYFVSEDGDFWGLNLNDNSTEVLTLARFNSAYNVQYGDGKVYHNTDHEIGVYNISDGISYLIPDDYGAESNSPFNYPDVNVINMEYDSTENLLYFAGESNFLALPPDYVLFGYFNSSNGVLTEISDGTATTGFPDDIAVTDGGIYDIEYDSSTKRLFGVSSDGGFWVYQFPVAIAEATPEPPVEEGNQITGGVIYTTLSESGNGLGTFLSAITHPLGSFIFYIAIIGAVITLVVGVVYGIRKIAKRF